MPVLIVGLLLIIAFAILTYIEPRRLVNYFLLGSGLFLILVYLLVILAAIMADINVLMQQLVSYLFIGLLLLVALLFFTTPFFLFYNGAQLIRREGFKLRNLLTISFGMLLLLLFFWQYLEGSFQDQLFINEFLAFFYLFFQYAIAFSLLVLFASVVYSLLPKQKEVDYLIILGSGLIDGKVTKLLANRLDRALKQREKQLSRFNSSPLLIVSGGKGKNEIVSEAEAMKNYLLEKGIAEGEIILEDKSTSTRENLLFSSQLINNKSKRVYFSTSNYHVFRSALLARGLQLKYNGLSARVAWYYVPNAYLRELIGIFVIYRYWHIVVLTPFLLLFILDLVAKIII